MMQNPTPSAGRSRNAARQPRQIGGLKRDVNLLPVNETSEKIARRGTIALAVFVGLLLLAYFAIVLPLGSLNDLKNKAAIAESQLAAAQQIDAEFNAAAEQKKTLQAMLTSLDASAAGYMNPADLMAMLTKACPDSITLLSVSQSSANAVVTGRAAADADVAQFIVNVRSLPNIFGVELGTVKQSEDARDAGRMFELTVRLAPEPAPSAAPTAAPTETAKGGDAQ